VSETACTGAVITAAIARRPESTWHTRATLHLNSRRPPAESG
jgi:hypothetical protein